MAKPRKKKLQYKYVIRESDFIKHRSTFVGDNVTWTPITKEFLEQQAVWFTLKNKKYIADQYRHWPWPSAWLYRTHLPLYNYAYRDWLSHWNEDGFIEITAGLRQPKSILGILEVASTYESV